MSLPMTNWLPIRLYLRAGRPMLDWCYAGDRRFSQPFWEQDIAACLRLPFNQLLRLQTPLETILDLEDSAASPPAGFIFHMSRCGSTLIAQMLAALPSAVVVAEPGVLTGLLSLPFERLGLAPELVQRYARALVGILGRPRRPEERRSFVKFDSWSTLYLPVLRAAFPEVPWVFVHRDPVEVLVSHQAHRAGELFPGLGQAALLGIAQSELPSMNIDEYAARVLGAYCRAALAAHRDGSGRFVDYRTLPDSLLEDLGRFWGLDWSAAERAAMAEISRRNAKDPSRPWQPDSDQRRRAASPELRDWSAALVEPWYRQILAGG